MREIPANYDEVYQNLTREGARVLALAYKDLGQITNQQIREIARETVERDLNFAGFVIISCPLKLDSKAMIKEIQQSSHRVVMITGDNPLTACHVAKELRFVRKQTLILQEKGGVWNWISVDESIKKQPIPDKKDFNAFTNSFDLCLTGQAMSYLNSIDHHFLQRILSNVQVFARVAPKQKVF